MKKIWMILSVLFLVLSFSAFQPGSLIAGEHGGKEHAGEEHEGTAMEGSHGMASEEDVVALKEAAALLKDSHPDLAAKLEKMVEEHSA